MSRSEGAGPPVIRGLATADATYEVTRALAERLGKQTVLSRDIRASSSTGC